MSGKMTKFKDLLVDTPNRYTVNGEVKTIVFAPNAVTQEGTKDKAEYFNEMQKNGLYNVNATRVVEGTVEFYDIAIEGSDIFDVFDTQFIINFNETNTKLNPVLRFNGNNYYIRFIENFIDIDVPIGYLQKTYICFLDSTNNKVKLLNYERKLTFDTVADAQAYNGFVVGDRVQVLGYYSKNDGAGHMRKIESSDDGSGINLGNGLWANYIVENGIVNIIHFGAKGDGITDDTIFFKKAINLNKEVYVPKSQNFYKITEILFIKKTIKSNNAEIKRYNADGSSSGIAFLINNYSGDNFLVVEGFIIDLMWNGETIGESSHCICVGGSKNVIITNNTLKNPYGDCVYVGSRRNQDGSLTLDNLGVSDNVFIIKNKLINPRRQNVSIVSCDNTTIEENYIHNRSTYVACIDIEPNNNLIERARNVKIEKNEIDAVGCRFLLLYNKNNSEKLNVSVKENFGECKIFISDNINSVGYIENLHIEGNLIKNYLDSGFFIVLKGYNINTNKGHKVEKITIINNIDNMDGVDTRWYIEEIDNCIIKNNTFNKNRNIGIQIKDSKYSKMSFNNFKNFTSYAVYIYGESKNLQLEYNTVQNSENFIRVSATVENIIVDKNIFSDCINVYDTGTLQGYKDLRILKNEYVNCSSVINNTTNLKYKTSLEGFNFPNLKTLYLNTAPTTGTWTKGEKIYNSNPGGGSYEGWICILSGTPGTWKGFGLIES